MEPGRVLSGSDATPAFVSPTPWRGSMRAPLRELGADDMAPIVAAHLANRPIVALAHVVECLDLIAPRTSELDRLRNQVVEVMARGEYLPHGHPIRVRMSVEK